MEQSFPFMLHHPQRQGCSRIPRKLPFPPVHTNLASPTQQGPHSPIYLLALHGLGEKEEGLGQCIIPGFILLTILHPPPERGGLGALLSQGSCGCCSNWGHGSGLLANCLFSHLPALGSSRHSRSPPARRPQRHPKPASQLASAAPPPRLVLAIPPGLHFTRGSPLTSWGSAPRPSPPFLHGAEHPEQHPWLDTGNISLRPLLPHSWSQCHQHEPHALPLAGLVQGQPL